MKNIRVKFEDGEAMCSITCPRLTIANGKVLSACAITAQYGGYCGPWYRERAAELEADIARLQSERNALAARGESLVADVTVEPLPPVQPVWDALAEKE